MASITLTRHGVVAPERNGHIGTLTTALIYTRVSSDDQAREGVSLDAQLAECRRYAAGQGWLLGSEYQDVMTGSRDDRPQYQALLADTRQMRSEGQPVVVVVAALDRFGRKLLERVRCREELKNLGVSVHSVRDGGEVSDLVSNILASVAQEEVRRLGERVRAARRHITANGWHAVGRAPWGYTWREATEAERAENAPRTVLELDLDTAPYVQEAFERAAAGETVRRIALWVSDLPDAARARLHLNFAGVRLVLHRPAYVARHGDPGSPAEVLARPRCRWPALVDDATWQRAQEQIASHAHMPRQARGRFLLTGLLRCFRCGARMGGSSRNGEGRQPGYRCLGVLALGAAAPDTRCSAGVIAAQVDGAVLAEVCAVADVAGSRDGRLEAALRHAWQTLQQPSGTSDMSHRIRSLEAEAKRARQRLTDAAVLLVDRTIDKGGYELLRDKARADLDAAEAELERLRKIKPERELPSLDEVLHRADGWAIVVRGTDIPAQREVLSLLIEQVVPVRVGRGKYEVRIAWTSLGDALRQAATAATTDAAA